MSQGDLDFVKEAFGLVECSEIGRLKEHRAFGAGVRLEASVHETTLPKGICVNGFS